MISPIDGRYKENVKELEKYFSEEAFTKYRLDFEVKYLHKICNVFDVKLDDSRLKEFTNEDIEEIKKIELKINHDVKAIEYFISSRINEEANNFIHFGLTSEDANNIAYSLMIKDFLKEVYFPQTEKIICELNAMYEKYNKIVMLGRTHGQPASPTTLGKEMFNFSDRLNKNLKLIKSIKIEGKINGAVGNWNSFKFAEPNIDWQKFSRDFITELGLEPAMITTQINPDVNLLNIMTIIVNFNNVLVDMCQDIWNYISIGYFSQKKKEEEVGSSTMPHKVNPINFENAEGNLKIANGLLQTFVNTLAISRYQRDLSNSTIKRNYGVSFAHSILAYKNIMKGLDKIYPNEIIIFEDLEKHPEILTEAYQTYLRRLNYPNPYELFKNVSRGEKVTLEDFHSIIEKLNVSDEHKSELKRLRPQNYVGY